MPQLRKKAKRFRLRTKKLFLTFPQCEKGKQEVLPKLTKLAKSEIEFCVVAQEKHKDGKDHLHCVMLVKKPQEWPVKELDKLTGKRGNYQNAKNVYNTLKYVIKDGNYALSPTNFPLEEWMKKKKEKKNPKSIIIAQAIMDGKSLKEINEIFPGFLLQNLSKVKNYQSLIKSWDVNLKTPLKVKEKEYNQNDKKIVKWINENLFTHKRKWTQKHLFIHGATQMGKSTLLRHLGEFFPTYIVPMNEEFYDLYSDEVSLCVFDEFRSQKRITWLNSFLDGMHTLRVKGGQYLKKKPIPCIFTSNYHLSECFPKVYQDKPLVFQTIKRRLEIVEVKDFIKVEIEEKTEETAEVLEISEDSDE